MRDLTQQETDENSPEAKLYQLLDDIDTLSDVIKPTTLKGYEIYFKRVTAKHMQRHEILDTDGYKLYKHGCAPKCENKPVIGSDLTPIGE